MIRTPRIDNAVIRSVTRTDIVDVVDSVIIVNSIY